ncbi:hypothetical protein ENBRE01_2415 [Enteropsectra breve]|nr:hypothetical protein ENBRE01_2415 [Enteropsectra breve]
MSVSYKKFLQLRKLLIILVSGYLCTATADQSTSSHGIHSPNVTITNLLREVPCSFCGESLLISLPAFDKNFHDIKKTCKEEISSLEFYKTALIKNGETQLLHSHCAEKSKRSLSSPAQPSNKFTALPSPFIAECTAYENFDIAQVVISLSSVKEDSQLIFRYISRLLLESKEKYLSCLCRMDPGLVFAEQLRENIVKTIFKNNSYYKACVELYLYAKHENAEPINVINAVLSYFKSIPDSDIHADEQHLKCWELLVTRLKNAEELAFCVNEIINAIQPEHQSILKSLYFQMLTSYSSVCSQKEFSDFVLECILTGKGFIFNLAEEISHILPSFEGFLDTLEAHLCKPASVQKMVLTRSYQSIGFFLHKWYRADCLTECGPGMEVLLERFFVFKRKDIEEDSVIPDSEGFFSVYKTVFMSQSMAIQSFVYDHIIKVVFDLLALKDTETTMHYLNCIVKKENESKSHKAIYGFMSVLLNEYMRSLAVRKQMHAILVKTQNIDAAVLTIRHISCDNSIIGPLICMEKDFDIKIYEILSDKEYAMRFRALNWIYFLSGEFNDSKRRKFLETKMADLKDVCDIKTAVPEALRYDRRRNWQWCDREYGLMPSEVGDADYPARFPEEFVFAWCDRINFIGSTLDYLRLPGQYPFITKHIDIIMKYCLEQDKNNNCLGVKAFMACTLVRYAEFVDLRNKPLLETLLNSDHSFALINAVLLYLEHEERVEFLQDIVQMLGQPTKFTGVSIEEHQNIQMLAAEQYLRLENERIYYLSEITNPEQIISEEYFDNMEMLGMWGLNSMLEALLDKEVIYRSTISNILRHFPPFIPKSIIEKLKERSSSEQMDCS